MSLHTTFSTSVSQKCKTCNFSLLFPLLLCSWKTGLVSNGNRGEREGSLYSALELMVLLPFSSELR